MACYNLNRFYILALIAWQFNVFFGTQKIFSIFTNYVPRWRCTANETFARDCSVYESCATPIQFENHDFYSAALEFDWVCGPQRHFISLHSQVVFIGVLIGTVLFGYLSDRYGRKPISVVSLCMGITSVVLSGMAPDWRTLMLGRFFVGLACGPSTFIILMETILPEQRIIVRGFANWGIGRMMLTAVCFLFPHWREASFACAVVVAPALIILLLFFPESATWLHEKGKLEKVRKSDEKIARVAGVKYIEVKRPPSQPRGGIMDSLRNRTFMRRLGVLWMMFFTACISSYANDLNSSSLSGNLFVNQIMFGVLITFSKIMLVVIDTCFPNFSRRNLHHYAQSAVCLCFLTLTVLVAYQANPWFILFFNLLGSMSIEFTWDACFLCAVESVPTNVRSRAVASCSLVARIGAIMSPYLVYLNAFWAPCTFLLVASIGFVNLLVSYKWLEETKGVSLDRIGLEDLPEMDAERETATFPEKEAMLPTNKTVS